MPARNCLNPQTHWCHHEPVEVYFQFFYDGTDSLIERVSKVMPWTGTKLIMFRRSEFATSTDMGIVLAASEILRGTAAVLVVHDVIRI